MAKFCQHCGASVPDEAVICTSCGCQIGQMKTETPNIVIQNTNVNENVNTNIHASAVRHGKRINQKTAFWLCLLGGLFGAHKFYEGKIGMGVLYLCTCGLFCFGWIIDCISISKNRIPTMSKKHSPCDDFSHGLCFIFILFLYSKTTRIFSQYKSNSISCSSE